VDDPAVAEGVEVGEGALHLDARVPGAHARRGLEDQIDDAFTAAFAEVDKLRTGSRFLAYNQLTDDQQRAVKQSVEALAEPLARVQGTLGVQSK
jgi:iron uptake system EfeUOB component EfeO/EfeM